MLHIGTATQKLAGFIQLPLCSYTCTQTHTHTHLMPPLQIIARDDQAEKVLLWLEGSPLNKDVHVQVPSHIRSEH